MDENDDLLASVERMEYGWSDAQSIAMCVVATISSLLSLWGSWALVRGLYRNNSKQQRQRSSLFSASFRGTIDFSNDTSENNSIFGFCGKYWARLRLYSLKDRLLLSVCVADVILTLDFLFGLYLIPRDTGLVWAYGNQTTCSTVAFFFFFNIAVCWTNAGLALYFYWKVCKGLSDDYIAKYYEIPLYCISFGLSIIMASIVLGMGASGMFPLVRSCNLWPNPTDCVYSEEIECTANRNIFIPLFITVSVCQFAGFLVALVSVLRVRSAIRQSTSQAQAAGSDAAYRRNLRVQRQALLYFLSYFNSFLWFTLLGILANIKTMEEVGQSRVYIFSFLSCLFFPGMGFFNYFIYVSEKEKSSTTREARNRLRQGVDPNGNVAEQSQLTSRPFNITQQSQNVETNPMNGTSSLQVWMTNTVEKTEEFSGHEASLDEKQEEP